VFLCEDACSGNLKQAASLREKEEVMNCHQLIGNWNGQVARLCNWTINRLESTVDKGDLKTTTTTERPRSEENRTNTTTTTEIR